MKIKESNFYPKQSQNDPEPHSAKDKPATDKEQPLFNKYEFSALVNWPEGYLQFRQNIGKEPGSPFWVDQYFVIKPEYYSSKFNTEDGLFWLYDQLQGYLDARGIDNKWFAKEHGSLEQALNKASDGELSEMNVELLEKNQKSPIENSRHRQIKFILEQLAKVGGEKTLEFIFNVFLNQNFNSSIYNIEIANILSAINPRHASQVLLKLIKDSNFSNKKSDSRYKSDITKILYRLEFGQINISEQGVEYLERIYDLGELNRSDYFVQRLTSEGDVGVFDEQKVLQKYFNLGNLSSDEQILKPRIQEFVYETLFRVKEGETQEERNQREKYLQEFKESYFGFYDADFFKKTGVRFNNLGFKEQGWFLLFYKHADEEKREKLSNFVREFGEQGLISFLSLEYNDNNGEKILLINDKLDKEIVEKVFTRYVKIQANAQKLEEMMDNSGFLEKEEMTNSIKQKLRENIYDAVMSRATDLLSTAYQITQNGEAKANFYTGKEISVTEINEVVEAMDVYEDFLEKMKGFFAEEGRYQFKYDSSINRGELSIHDFIVDNKETGARSYASVSLRSDGTNKHMKDFEYDGEARVNFLFNNEPISPDIQNKSRKEATTFRLDRECLTFDESGQNVISKDNTREDGRLSFDFGSIYEDSGRENSVLGRVMSVGNYYVAQEKKKKPEYYHNKESFYSDLGRADVFKQITGAVEAFIQFKYVKKGAEEVKRAA